jgi:hypothetical protein
MPTGSRAGVPRPLTPLVGATFSAIAALILVVSAVTLVVPETPLSRIWDIKPKEYQQLLAIGSPVALGFLAIAVIAARLVMGSPLEAAFGVLIAALVLWWLLRPTVRAQFH